MDGAVEKGVCLTIVSRGDDTRSYGRRQPDHGFFNARSSGLPELPLRDWGEREDASARRERPRLLPES
ncbi:MAG: hypothetical protein ACTHJ3_11765 [Pararhizobium sp.]